MSQKVDIAGVKFDAVRYDDVITAVEVFVSRAHQKHMIATPNPEMVVDANQRNSFKNLLNSTAMLVPDGIGILWASYYLSLPYKKNRVTEWTQRWISLLKVFFKHSDIYSILPQRVTGSDLLCKIVDASQRNHWRIYLLGAAPGIASIAIDRMLQKYPDAIFAGSFAGTPAETHEDELCERINQAQPDILFVAYGSPAQEEWIHRNLDKLDTVKVAIGVGGAIDFAAGKAKRAPQWMQKMGLEWLWRLIRQPRRYKRIWNATFHFIKLIRKYKKMRYQETEQTKA